MARIDDLLRLVADPHLRQELTLAVEQLRDQRKFGLVFEEHIPEFMPARGIALRPGGLAARRGDSTDHAWRVVAVDGDVASLADLIDGTPEQMPVSDLVALRRFGEPMYPTLERVDRVNRGGDRPYHTVIDAENYHALELLLYAYEGQVDVIYADPPYNTGARDWKYNNHYVDINDDWRHSKWLSMMERRLQLAKRLLKPDGVLIITIDENEAHHLGMLLEQEHLFKAARRQMVTICINPSGSSGEGLSRVEEYALFCFLGDREPVSGPDDMLNAEGASAVVQWESLLRRGNAWYRAIRKNLCYPVLLDQNDDHRIVGVGTPFPDGMAEDARPLIVDGYEAAWPVRNDGRLGIWRVDGRRLMVLAEQGYAYVSSRDDTRGTWTIRYLMKGTVDGIAAGAIRVTGRGPFGQVLMETSASRRTIPKTMWHRGRHTAGGAGGTQMLSAILGRRDAFPYPKSLYAVRDCLNIAVGDRPDALVLDYFAGSGTTFQATCLLNAEDGGTRRCLLVTNNEVDAQRAAILMRRGVFPGDPEYERHGIFQSVTHPRCKFAVTGQRDDGVALEGAYLGGQELADGFDENVEFQSLRYLDPDELAYRRDLRAILPVLWLCAGGYGDYQALDACQPCVVGEDVRFAVLTDEAAFPSLLSALRDRPDITHVFLVTDSEEAFREMRADLPRQMHTSMLFRDYLRNFRVNSGRSG
ncbi:MAG TPA: DNA methyltransferase [Chloroflexota bacterium]|nr:DNA methyltransferase [Chloroflexota bacterium]